VERAEEQLERRKTEQLEERRDNLQEFVQALEDQDLEAGQNALETI